MSGPALIPFIAKAVAGFVVGKVVGKITGNELLGAIAGGFAGGMINIGGVASGGAAATAADLTSSTLTNVGTDAVTFGGSSLGGGSFFSQMLSGTPLESVTNFFGGGELASGAIGGVGESGILNGAFNAGNLGSDILTSGAARTLGGTAINNATAGIGAAMQSASFFDKGALPDILGQGNALAGGGGGYGDLVGEAGKDLLANAAPQEKGLLERLLPSSDEGKEMLGKAGESYFKSMLEKERVQDYMDAKSRLEAENYAREHSTLSDGDRQGLINAVAALKPAGYATLGSATRGYSPAEGLRLRRLQMDNMNNRQRQLDALYGRTS